MMDSCTSMGVERNTAIYAPANHLTGLILLRRIMASSSAGITASSTDTTASSSVYSKPRTKAAPYLGRNEKLKKLVLSMLTNRSFHDIDEASFQKF